MTGNFADTLESRIQKAGSVLCAGFDPQPSSIPRFIQEEAAKSSKTDGEFIYQALRRFYGLAIDSLKDSIAAIKPNIAFFEQFGINALRALAEITFQARDAGIPVIMDAKRGDIGSTAEAYAQAFLGKPAFLGRSASTFHVDSLTVNPFLGFDTLEPFIKVCEAEGKGIYVLVKTSNPGSKDLQDRTVAERITISSVVAGRLAEQASRLMGSSGLSSLGAVVGATHPAEAKALRELMPSNLFLIPGYGAQGGSAEDATAGFTKTNTGGVINVSRCLFGSLSSNTIDSLGDELVAKAKGLNTPLMELLAKP